MNENVCLGKLIVKVSAPWSELGKGQVGIHSCFAQE